MAMLRMMPSLKETRGPWGVIFGAETSTTTVNTAVLFTTRSLRPGRDISKTLTGTKRDKTQWFD